MDLDTLDLINGYKCICGQVFKENASGWVDFNGYDLCSTEHFFAQANSWISALVKGDNDRAEHVAYVLVFNIEGNRPYTGLQKEWTRVLKERQAASV